jgi:hypothetical protein
VVNGPEKFSPRVYALLYNSPSTLLQVQCNYAGGGEGTNADEDIHLVPEGTTTLHQVQGRDERQTKDSGQYLTGPSLASGGKRTGIENVGL